MAYEATPAAARWIAAVRGSDAVRAAWRVTWTTRAAVLVVAVFAALTFGPATGGLARENAAKFDEPALTHSVAEPLLAPLARWDAVWYLRIADSGYGDSVPRAAFFPLYPLLIHAAAAPVGGSEAALLIASYLISLAAFLGALVLLYRLVSLELGRRFAGPALLLLAVFPAALYFGAPYSESLFLLVSVGAFYAARTDSWAWAGACAAAASASWKVTRCASWTCRMPGRGSSPCPSGGPGTGSRRPSTACVSSRRAGALRSTSRRPPAIRSASPRST